MSWKIEYIKWYRLSEEVLKGLIPHLSDDEVLEFVLQTGWLIIPTSYEKDKKASINRPDPNIYISLNDGISVGIHCNTMESVRRLRNIMLGFYSEDRTRLILALRELDKRFTTNVEKKIKEHHFSESPRYEIEFEIASHKISESDFHKIFETVDEIQAEGDQRMEERKEHWRAIAPVINIARVDIAKSKNEFKQVMNMLKPIYEIVLGIRTSYEIKREIRRGQAKCPKCGAKLLIERETGDVYCSECLFILGEEELGL